MKPGFVARLRVDGIDPDDPAHVVPPGRLVTVDLLAEAIQAAVARAVITSPDSEATSGAGQIHWGDQLDIRPIGAFDGDAELSDEAVAGYIAKYATKAAEATGTIDTPLCCRACSGTGMIHPAGADCGECAGSGCTQSLDHLKVAEHAKQMLLTCWTLGGVPELADLGLRRWAHMLGFGGHFSTKSRRYSTTLITLRNVRRDWRTTKTMAALGLDANTTVVRRSEQDPPDYLDDQGSVLVLGHWRYAGPGHSPSQALFAKTIAEELAESRRAARQAIREEEQLWKGAA